MDERLDSEKNSYSHILKYTGLFGGVQGLNMLVGVVRNKFTAMFLGPSGMGLLSLFNSTSNFLSSASNLGIPTSGVRVVSEADAGNGKDQAVAQVRSLCLLSAFLGALICALLGPLLNLFTFRGEIIPCISFCWLLLSSLPYWLVARRLFSKDWVSSRHWRCSLLY